MDIIKPYVEGIDLPDAKSLYRKIETAGRVCYKSEDKMTEDTQSAEKLIQEIISRGHEAVLEHGTLTFKFVCDRGVSHEIVRHRIASYCQESTRYCNYSKGKFGSEITVIQPCYLEPGTPQYTSWKAACLFSEVCYMNMLNEGATAQEARAVLPNSLKTEIIVTMDIREWRHFFKLRCSRAAHPQMREVARMAFDICRECYPVLFEDLEEVIA